MLHSNLKAVDGDSGVGWPHGKSLGTTALDGPGSRIVEGVSSDETDFSAAIRVQLNRIVASSMFVQSERLARFLSFTVETTLEGNAESLKEYVVGTQVYGRKASYHPTEDSIVRSEARRLRRKLQEYYETGGKDDLVVIHYTPGSYVPKFELRGEVSGLATVGCLRGQSVKSSELRVAVLPFLDLSNGATSGACAQCLTDELIHQLVRIDGVRVTTACVEKLESIDIPSLARRLDVQVVFEGTVGEDSSQLRVTARVAKSDGLRIWSERFETNRDSRFLLDISSRIASALINRLDPEPAMARKQSKSCGTSALQISPLVLRAEALLDEGTAEAARLALGKWQEALEIDPDDVRAICGLSQCYCEIAMRGTPDSAAAISRANHAAERAIQLDADLPLALTCRASGHALSWRWREAEACFKRALDPGENCGTFRQYAVCLAAQGRFREAWSLIQRAQQIDPFSYRQKVVYTRLLYLSRNYEKGLRYLSEQLLYGRLPDEAEVYRAMMLISHDRLDEARQIARNLSEKFDVHASTISGVAEILARCGDSKTAVAIAYEHRLFDSESPISRFRQALLLLALGDREKAVLMLAQACDQKEVELIWLTSDPRLDPIRGDCRFAGLQKRVGLDSAIAVSAAAMDRTSG